MVVNCIRGLFFVVYNLYLNQYKPKRIPLLIPMKIVTAVVNNPTFIEIQYHTLKKYLRGVDAYEFIVFNDAKPFPDETNDGDLTLRTKIEETCRGLGILCIPIPNDHHLGMSMSNRHADTFNKHVLRYQLEHPDKYLLLDSDMFLIAELDMRTYFQYECALVLQSRSDSKLNYFWPGLCYLDFNRIQGKHLLNWAQGRGGDTGGMMADWLKLQANGAPFPNTDDLRWKKDATFPNETIYYIRHLWSGSWNETELPANLKERKDLLTFFQEDVRNPTNGNYYCEIYDNVFLHYRAGGNWNREGMTLHNTLADKLKAILV